ncbi:MAG: DNA polymerase I [Myxococcales bacterium]|nr:DNA polymerase I [Myxococcales bacterium]
MPKKLFLVDGSNHAFRVQYALPPQHASDGFPTRVLYGFTLLFQKMMNAYRPDYCVVSFDSGKSFRHDTYADYKGHRPDMPEDMKRQWEWLPKLVEGFGYPCIQAPGFEADDVLGSLAVQLASDEVDVYIVSSDKDFAQLMSPNIHLLDEGKAGKIFRVADIPSKFKLGEGVELPPERVLDLLALSGDTTDNIPGVPGIGDKTAAKLIGQHGDLESILSAAAEGKIKGKRGQNLVEHADAARLSRELAQIKTDLDLGVTVADLAPKGVQEAPLRRMFDDWEFMEVANKLLPHRVAVDKSVYVGVADPDGLQALLGRLRSAGRFGVSLRTTDTKPESAVLLGVGFATADEVSYVPLVPRGDVQLDVEKATEQVLELLADPTLQKVGFDLKRQLRICRRLGHDLPGVTGDIELLDYVLVAHRRTHGLKEIAKRHLGHNLAYAPSSEPLMLSDVVDFAAEPAHLALLLEERLDRRLDEGTRRVYEEIELPLLPVLADMEQTGIVLDLQVMDEIIADIGGRVLEAEKHCHEVLGRPFKVGSPKEVQEILFDELELPKIKRTKTGYSTDASVLEKLSDQHPLPQAILDWRSLQKLESTYLRTLPGFVAGDGRIHTTFNQAVAATGRLSSQDPNLQNIPVRTFEGRRIRDGFVAGEGYVLMSADYSQVELRVLAHFCGSGALVDSFNNGEDIHRRTASEVFDVAMDEVTASQRTAAKAINFGLMYGMSAFRLGRDLDIAREDAQQYMDDYFGRIPQVSAWIDATKEACRKQGFVQTLFGRRRLIPEIYSKDFTERMAGEREAVNTVVQGTAADLIKIAMIRVHAALKASGSGARLLLQVHDELLLEVPEDQIEVTRELLVTEMMGVAELAVPLEVDVGHGHNWNQAHLG